MIFIFVLMTTKAPIVGFDGQKAYQAAQYQMTLGPRVPGSDAHNKVVVWIKDTLSGYGWDVEIQNGQLMGHSIQNIIAKRGSGSRWVILGAHYDSRIWADQDPNPDMRSQPVPGADDGASGVAVLLELARVIPKDLQTKIWLVFFDVEDNGEIAGWDWLLGSKYFVQQLVCCPDAVVVVDMIGDKNLDIYEESSSTQALTDQIWAKANGLGFASEFIPQKKFSMIDDHTPFLEAGMNAVDIIDFDYPYWHTTQDTMDKISARSLQVVGETLLSWIKQP